MKPRAIGKQPEVTRFIPAIPEDKANQSVKEPVKLTFDEFETLRLVDYEGLMQGEAAMKMEISRGTVWRCLDSARRKMATMLVEGRELMINGAELSSQSVSVAGTRKYEGLTKIRPQNANTKPN